MTSTLQHLRFAVRMLLKNPGFALVSILTLGVGIGTNTAIFSAVDALLLHPLPFRNPAQLVLVTKNMPSFSLMKSTASALDFMDYRDLSRSFSGMAGLVSMPVNLTGGDDPARASGMRVSASLFSILGVRPVIGRFFRTDEEQPGGDKVTVLTEGLWKSRFAGDRKILGQQIQLSGQNFTVIGVVEPLLQFLAPSELYMPLALTPAQLAPNQRGHQNMQVVARLKPSVPLPRANAEMKTVATRMTQRLPGWYPAGWSIDLDPLTQSVAGELRDPLLVLMAGVGILLLTACANVANLLLARATSRYKEIGIRTALGADRGQIVAQLLTESILLAVLGGTAGLFLGMWLFDLFGRFAPAGLLRGQTLGMNGLVVAFTFGLSLITSVLFGLAPALTASRGDLIGALKDSARSLAGSKSGQRLRASLVVAEVALSVVLLAGSGLLIRSFERAQRVNPGFNPSHLLTARVSLPAIEYQQDRVAQFYSRLSSAVQALPGVLSAGYVDSLPYSGNRSGGSFNIVGHPWPPSSPIPDVDYLRISPGYVPAMRIPVMQGRNLSEADGADAPLAALVDATFARTFFPKGDAIGQRLTGPDAKGSWHAEYRIVGIVGALRDRSLIVPPQPLIYYPALQTPAANVTLIVRTSGDPLAAVAGLQARVRELDRNLPLFGIATMERRLADSLQRRRMSTLLLAILAAMGIVLSGIGIYSVVAYMVGQRTPEIGVRMALGATSREILGMVLRQAIRPVAAGVIVGILAAGGVNRAMGSLLFETSPADPLTLGAVTAMLLIVAVAAISIPARRAARVDPVVALRWD